MKNLNVWACALLALPMVACGPSKSNAGLSDAADSVAVEEVAEEQNVDLQDDPQALADFAVECFRTRDFEPVLPYATDKGRRQLEEDMAIEKQMQNDRGFREMREQLEKTVYTCVEASDMGSSAKLMRYKSTPKGYNVKVLLEMHGGKWQVDLVGGDR